MAYGKNPPVPGEMDTESEEEKKKKRKKKIPKPEEEEEDWEEWKVSDAEPMA
jgi:hypothetical protein